MPPPFLLTSTPYKVLQDMKVEVALLPWGATEAHNLHLPYGTDIIESEQIATESARLAASEGARIMVLPTVPYGVNTGQLDIPLIINMNPSTQMALLDDIATSLEYQKVPKLLILNGHGGNDFKQMIRELTLKHSIFFCTINWWTFIDPKPFFDEVGDHAGEMETSLMLHIAPSLVLPLSEAGSGRERKMRITAFRNRKAWTPRQWTRVTSDTGTGNPKAATAEKGKRYFEALTRSIAGFLVELSAANPSDLYEQ